MHYRHLLRRWHIWLGWIIGIPFLLWTVSGLVMVAKPIEEVRGEGLLREAPGLPSGFVPVPPAIGPRAVSALKLERRAGGGAARWRAGVPFGVRAGAARHWSACRLRPEARAAGGGAALDRDLWRRRGPPCRGGGRA